MATVLAEMPMSPGGFAADPSGQAGRLLGWYGNGEVDVPAASRPPPGQMAVPDLRCERALPAGVHGENGRAHCRAAAVRCGSLERDRAAVRRAGIRGHPLRARGVAA